MLSMLSISKDQATLQYTVNGGELTKHMEAHGVEGMPKREGGAHLQSRSAGKADLHERVSLW